VAFSWCFILIGCHTEPTLRIWGILQSIRHSLEVSQPPPAWQSHDILLMDKSTIRRSITLDFSSHRGSDVDRWPWCIYITRNCRPIYRTDRHIPLQDQLSAWKSEFGDSGPIKPLYITKYVLLSYTTWGGVLAQKSCALPFYIQIDTNGLCACIVGI